MLNLSIRLFIFRSTKHRKDCLLDLQLENLIKIEDRKITFRCEQKHFCFQDIEKWNVSKFKKIFISQKRKILQKWHLNSLSKKIVWNISFFFWIMLPVLIYYLPKIFQIRIILQIRTQNANNSVIYIDIVFFC